MIRNLTLGLLTACSLSVFGAVSNAAIAADSDDPTAAWTAPVVDRSNKPAAAAAPASYTPKVACNCAAQLPPDVPPPPKDPKKKQHKILKGLGKELGMEMGDLGKDMFLAFSVSGKDPYEMPKNPNIPYVYAEAQFIDGSSSHIYKYPDSSFRVQGGFLDGTYACKQPSGEYVVQYPNGAQGAMHLTSEGAKIVRPDNTVTTMSHVGSGQFRVVNSKLGYIGDVTPDTTGLSYEFAKQDF